MTAALVVVAELAATDPLIVEVMRLRMLAASLVGDPAVRAALDELTCAVMRARIVAMLAPARDRGEVRADLDLEHVAWLWVGFTLSRGFRHALHEHPAAPLEFVPVAARSSVRCSAPVPEEAADDPDHPNHKWWTLFAMCFALFMIMLDNTIVNVALPSIQHSLNPTPENLEWTINAYVLVFATLILLGGKLGDRFGRKRIFLVGLAIFTLASAGCALAQTDTQLIGVPRRAGRRRRAPEPALALDPRGRVPAQAAARRRSASGPASRASASPSARCWAASWSSTSRGRPSSG